MKKIKVSEATGPVLDWMVARAEGHRVSLSRNWFSAQDEDGFSMKVSWKRDGTLDAVHWWAGQRYSPSSDWSQGGPIIERERIRLDPRESVWHAQHWDGEAEAKYAPSPLIAAMRCFVASKLGDEVEVPEELL